MDALTTKCPHCGARYKVDEVYSGREVICRTCTKSFIVRPEVQGPHVYCRTCGQVVKEGAYACMSCGCDPRMGDEYCPNCGAKVRQEQVVCVACGAALRLVRGADRRMVSGATDGNKKEASSGHSVTRKRPLFASVVVLVSYILATIMLAVIYSVALIDPPRAGHVLVLSVMLVPYFCTMIMMALFMGQGLRWSRIVLTVLHASMMIFVLLVIGVDYLIMHREWDSGYGVLLLGSVIAVPVNICLLVFMWLRPVNQWMSGTRGIR